MRGAPMFGTRLARFHFNIRRGDALAIDVEGVLLLDVGDAIAKALV